MKVPRAKTPDALTCHEGEEQRMKETEGEVESGKGREKTDPAPPPHHTGNAVSQHNGCHVPTYLLQEVGGWMVLS